MPGVEGWRYTILNQLSTSIVKVMRLTRPTLGTSTIVQVRFSEVHHFLRKLWVDDYAQSILISASSRLVKEKVTEAS